MGFAALGKFGKRAFGYASQYGDDVANLAGQGRRYGGQYHGMPSFGGNRSGYPSFGGMNQRPSLMDRAMGFADMLGGTGNMLGGNGYGYGGNGGGLLGGIGGMVNGATNIAHYGEMGGDAWNAFGDVMKEGFNAHTVGQLAGVVADGVIYDKLQDFGIPAPVAMMLSNVAQNFIEDFADKYQIGGGAKGVAESDNPEAKKDLAEAEPNNKGEHHAPQSEHKSTSHSLAAGAIQNDPEQHHQDTKTEAKHHQQQGNGTLSKVADWVDGAATVAGNIVPGAGDLVGGGLGVIAAGMHGIAGDGQVTSSLLNAGAAVVPGPGGMLLTAGAAAYEMTRGDDTPRQSRGSAPSTAPDNRMAQALSGTGLSNLISGAGSVGEEQRMQLGCTVPSASRTSNKNHVPPMS